MHHSRIPSAEQVVFTSRKSLTPETWFMAFTDGIRLWVLKLIWPSPQLVTLLRCEGMMQTTNISSVAYDSKTLTLYVHVSQRFRIWIVPFYVAPVSLVTVLQLIKDKKTDKYLIQSQHDLYQVCELVRLLWFGGWLIVWLLQLCAALVCSLGAALLWPQTWIEENWFRSGWKGLARWLNCMKIGRTVRR